MSKLLITISPLGIPTMDVQGCPDASCKNTTKPYEEALSGGKEDAIETCDKAEASIPAGTGLATTSF